MFKNHYNRSKFGYSFDEYGLNSGLNLYYEFLKISLGWEGVIRDLTQAPNAPFGIREQLGLTMKSSFKMTASYDTRDSAVFPSYGSLVNWVLEVGGIDVILKNELSHQKTFTTILGLAVTESFSLGVLNAFGKFSILDGFYLGGPLTFRGFEECGVGKINMVALQVHQCTGGATYIYTLHFHFYLKK